MEGTEKKPKMLRRGGGGVGCGASGASGASAGRSGHFACPLPHNLRMHTVPTPVARAVDVRVDDHQGKQHARQPHGALVGKVQPGDRHRHPRRRQGREHIDPIPQAAECEEEPRKLHRAAGRARACVWVDGRGRGGHPASWRSCRPPRALARSPHLPLQRTAHRHQRQHVHGQVQQAGVPERRGEEAVVARGAPQRSHAAAGETRAHTHPESRGPPALTPGTPRPGHQTPPPRTRRRGRCTPTAAFCTQSGGVVAVAGGAAAPPALPLTPPPTFSHRVTRGMPSQKTFTLVVSDACAWVQRVS